MTVFVVFTVLSFPFEGSSCRFRGQNASDSEQILVESFKKKMLKELGFSTAPNVSGLRPPKIPEILRNLVEAENRKYKRMAEEVDDKLYAKTKQIFLFPEEGEIYFLFALINSLYFTPTASKRSPSGKKNAKKFFINLTWEAGYFFTSRGLENVSILPASW